LQDAFVGNKITFGLIHNGQNLTSGEIEPVLSDNGYIAKFSSDEVVELGDYYINQATQKIDIKLLHARFPLNSLVIGDQPNQLAFVTIQGKSGYAGADFWTFNDWVVTPI
jgi:hypothetical protein